jgi:hypothetical protein
MKRAFLLLIMVFSLLLVACSADTHTFVMQQDGRYVDEETEAVYTMQDGFFEAGRSGEEIGRYEDEENGYSQVFYAIPNLDPNEFLTDDNGDVYCADGALPAFADWSVDVLLVCREIGLMDEVKQRFDATSGAETVAAVRELWLTGEDLGNIFLLESVTSRYAVKMGSAAYPNLYGALELRFTENQAYLCDKGCRRTVAVDAALAERLCKGA